MAVSNVRQATSDPPDKLALLRHHPLFGQLPPRVIQHLGSYMRKRTLARGENIFFKGDLGSGLMGVLSGSVKISVPSADGRDIVLRIDPSGRNLRRDRTARWAAPLRRRKVMTDCELMVIERRSSRVTRRLQPVVVMVIATATDYELQIEPEAHLMPGDFFARLNTLICVMDPQACRGRLI